MKIIMKFLKDAINSSLFKAVVCLVIGLALILEKHPLYAGVAFGVAIREFLLAFENVENG